MRESHNVPGMITGIGWGAEVSFLLNIFRAQIRSLYDYGSFLYKSTSNSKPQGSEVVQTKALKV